MTRGRWLALAVAVAAALLGARWLAAAAVEYRWYAALGPGAASVWRAKVVAFTLLRGAAILAGTAFVSANLLGVVSTVETVTLPRRVGGLDIAERVPASRLRWVTAVVAPALGVLLALPLDGWTSVDAVVTGRVLGEIEPYTGHDLAFFIHWLPVENALYAWALLTLVVTAALVVTLYALTPGLRWAGGRLRVSARVRRHLTVFGAGVLLLLSWGHRLDAYALLSGGSGDNDAFSGVDQFVALPARFILAAATALAALVVLRAGWANQRRLAFWTVTAVVVGALTVRAAGGLVAARVIDPSVLARADAAAAANRALYTQRAYGVDRIRLAPAGYGAREGDPNVVSAWDATALRQAVAAARRTSIEGDVGFQAGASGVVGVLVERPSGGGVAGDAEARTLVLVDATRADAAGRPTTSGGEPLAETGREVRALVRPNADDGALRVRDEPAVVGDRLDGWQSRAAHALAGRDLRLAFESWGPDDRLVDRRDVRARVKALAPFFDVGASATPLFVADSLWYALPMHTASETHPLSQRYAVAGDVWASFRHAGHALVNAQSGAVRIVAAGDADAEVRAWVRRFPRLFTTAASLPAALRRAIPPPTDAARVQTYAFAQYGARGERVASIRRVPPDDDSDSTVAGSPRGVLLLPSPGRGAIDQPTVPAWTLPLLSAADRVEGVAVSLGGAGGGTLWLPLAETGARWQEILDTLRAPSNGQPPIATVRGRLRAVPLQATLAFAQPEYRIVADRVPLLTRVVGVGAAGVRQGATVDIALGRASADSTTAAIGLPGVAPTADPLTRARAAYRASREALQRGDWGALGRAFEALGAALEGPEPPPR